MPFTQFAIDTFISQKIKCVTECNLSDMYLEFPGARNWVSGFGLMVVLVDQPPQANRALALQIVRRTEMAFAEYAVARNAIEEFISGAPGRWSPYYHALYHLESAVAQLYQAFDFARKAMNTKLFEVNDGSPLNRLNSIYGTSKHQRAEADQPVWFTNDGLETALAKLSFREFEELLRTFGRITTTLTSTSKSSDDPAV